MEYFHGLGRFIMELLSDWFQYESRFVPASHHLRTEYRREIVALEPIVFRWIKDPSAHLTFPRTFYFHSLFIVFLIILPHQSPFKTNFLKVDNAFPKTKRTLSLQMSMSGICHLLRVSGGSSAHLSSFEIKIKKLLALWGCR